MREDQPQAAAGEAEPKQSKTERDSAPAFQERPIWELIQEWGHAEQAHNPTALQRISNVTEYMDQLLDPAEVTEARKTQLRKLWQRGAFTPVLKKDIPRQAKLFHFKWVDKKSKGSYKNRFTCADVRSRYSEAEEQGVDTFVPAPTSQGHALLEIYALINGYYTRSLDIVAAFLIGQDTGAAEGNHVYMRAPV